MYKTWHQVVAIIAILFFFLTHDQLILNINFIEFSYLAIVGYFLLLNYWFPEMKLLKRIFPLLAMMTWYVFFNRSHFFWNPNDANSQAKIINRFDFLFKHEPVSSSLNNWRDTIFIFSETVAEIIFIIGFIIWNFPEIKKWVKSIPDHFGEIIGFFVFCLIWRANFISQNAWFTNINWIPKAHIDNQHAIDNAIGLSSKFNETFLKVKLVLIAPIWEELIFRLGIFTLFKRQRFDVAILISAVLFAVAHLDQESFPKKNDFIFNLKTNGFFNYLFYGLQYGLVYTVVRHKIIYNIFLHSYWNLAIVLIKY